MDNRTRAQLQFLAYTKAKHPTLYKAAVKRSGGLSGLGITQAEMLAEQDAFAEPTSGAETPWYRSLLDTTIATINQLAPSYVGIKQAQTCIEVNSARAKQGLSPIDCAASGLSPQVAVGVSSDVKYVLWGVLGLGAIFLFMNMKKR